MVQYSQGYVRTGSYSTPQGSHRPSQSTSFAEVCGPQRLCRLVGAVGRVMRMFDPHRPHVDIEVIEPKGPLGRAKGLIGRSGLGAGRGMLLKSRQVHTFAMSFPIDVVYLSRDGTVIKIRTLQPNRLGPLVWAARWVLEMEAGEAAKYGIRPGTRLSRSERQ